MRFYDEMDRVLGKKGSSQPASIQPQGQDEQEPGISVLQLALTRGQLPHIKMEVEEGQNGEGETDLDSFVQTGLTTRSPPPHLPPAAAAPPEQLGLLGKWVSRILFSFFSSKFCPKYDNLLHKWCS